MRNLFAALSVLLLALGLSACGSGSQSLDPSPRHPDDELEAPARPTPSDEGRFAQPPAGDEQPTASDEGRPEAAERRRAPESPAPPARSWDGAEKSAEPQAAAAGSGALRSPDALRSQDAERSRSTPSSEPPRDRPGLATHWGETRYSPAHEVSFERNDPSSPTATAELRYNDRRGARRLLPRGHWGQAELSLLGGALRVRMLDTSGRPFPALSEGGRLVSIDVIGLAESDDYAAMSALLPAQLDLIDG